MDMLNKFSDTALIVEDLGLWFGFVTQVGEYYSYACIEECLLTKSFQENFIVINCCFFKYKRVGFELYGSTRFGRIAYNFKLFAVLSPFKTLEMDMLAVLYGQFEPFGKCIYYRCANAVKTACDLISAAAELTACVEYRINYRCGRNALFRVDTRRDSSTVIGNFDNIAGENFYIISEQ